jgi:hypothetical protein
VVRTPRKEKLTKIVATFVYASSQGQRTHSARTNILLKAFCEGDKEQNIQSIQAG